MTTTYTKTPRGFGTLDMTHDPGTTRLQESSRVDPHLWLHASAHLDRAEVRALSRALNHWLRTGRLPETVEATPRKKSR